MQFSFFSAVFAFAALSAAPALAANARQVYNIPGNSGTDFCNSWRCACINYVPKSQISFDIASCEPGNFQGNNKNSQATAFCIFVDNNNKEVLVNKHVAAATGATIA